MKLDLINERRNNKIFTDGEYAYKIFKKGYSKNDVFMEAFVTSIIESMGLKVPSLQEVCLMDGQWTFKYPLIKGQSLYDMMQSDPDNIDKYMDQLISIQTSIHTRKCPTIPVQKQKLTDYINISNLDKSLKIDLLDMLNSSPKHKKLCHGNFTPHNVILCDGIPYITDWNHACQGNASADVARTYLWMKINMPDYSEIYLDKFCKLTGTSSRYVNNWIPIVAAARLAKNNPEEIKILNSLISVVEY
ncbi:MAG: phosphotransferase family protein [Eubacterium sp.]